MATMAAAIALRSDFAGGDLRRLARRTQDAKQTRRLLALAMIYDGGSRGEAARISDVGLQIIRDWVLRFNAEGPDGLIDRKAPGPEPRLTDVHRTALAATIESGPIPAVHGVVCWRLPISASGCGRSSGSASPGRRWAVSCAAWVIASSRLDRAIMPRRRERSSILKRFPAIVAEMAQEKGVEPAAIEVWFADEARIGQKNKITRRWARR